MTLYRRNDTQFCQTITLTDKTARLKTKDIFGRLVLVMDEEGQPTTYPNTKAANQAGESLKRLRLGLVLMKEPINPLNTDDTKMIVIN